MSRRVCAKIFRDIWPQIDGEAAIRVGGSSREATERHEKVIVSHFFCIGLAMRLQGNKTGNHTTMNKPNGNAERPVTTAQLAQHLQVSTRTIATYRAKRRIPF